MLKSAFSSFNTLQRSSFSAAVGLLGYGIWAYMVNSDYGSSAAFKAAMVQGGYSFVLTFVMTLLIEGLFQILSLLVRNVLLVKLLTAIMICGLIFSTSWWLNVMAGTPEVFKTVILGYIIGAIYTFSYTFGLSRKTVAGRE